MYVGRLPHCHGNNLPEIYCKVRIGTTQGGGVHSHHSKGIKEFEEIIKIRQSVAFIDK
jgi:hypothetical protein